MDNTTTVLGLTIDNWLTICLIGVGLSAFGIYKLQERKKINEAALLIILQIEELQGRIRELSTFIEDGRLNYNAFYESLPLMETNYWDKYKHLFVRKMEASSYNTINLFYQYMSEIQEQHLLMKNLQKNIFFHIQNIIDTIETRLISENLPPMNSFLPPPNNLNTIPNVPNTTSQSIPQHFDLTQFLNKFIPQRDNLKHIFNQNILFPYIPDQIRTSLEKILKKYSMLEITGTNGYRLLKKYSNRWF